MTTRKAFIESHGGTCRNWRWSWSFVNHNDKQVFFGGWTDEHDSGVVTILRDKWQYNSASGRKSMAYPQSEEHVRLVQNGYALFTFPMIRRPLYEDQPDGAAKIVEFKPVLTRGKLQRGDECWQSVSF